MDFYVDQRLAIIKTLIELYDSPRGSGLVQRRLYGGKWFNDNAIVFYEKSCRSCLATTASCYM